MPLFKKSLRMRLSYIREDPVFKDIYLIHIKFKTIFYFSANLTNFNDKFNITNFDNLLRYVTNWAHFTYTNQFIYLNTNPRDNNTIIGQNIPMYQRYLKNPFFYSDTKNNSLKFPIRKDYDISKIIITMSSISYKTSAVDYNLETLTDKNLMNDLINLDFSSNLLDIFSIASARKLEGIKVLVSNIADEVLTPTICYYLAKYHRIMQENLTPVVCEMAA
jgi:hypothetical protein